MAEKKTVLIPIADGVEDIETISVMDILTYAGMQVTIASLTENKLVKCANGTKIECNVLFKDIESRNKSQVNAYTQQSVLLRHLYSSHMAC